MTVGDSIKEIPWFVNKSLADAGHWLNAICAPMLRKLTLSITAT